jgi:hypothetical protein
MTEADDFERHRSLLGAIPIELSPMFDPFLQMLRDLGIEESRFGSFAVRQLDSLADPRMRLLAIPFPDAESAGHFMVRVVGEMSQRPDVEAIRHKLGPATCLEFSDAVLMFWFGVMGVEITKH